MSDKCIEDEDALRIVHAIKNSSDEDGVKIIVEIINTSMDKIIACFEDELAKKKTK